jgi:hypothetical protein
MRERIAQELALLRRHYGEDVEYQEHGDWFLVPRYPTPEPCQCPSTPVTFNLRPGYPGAEPYGFFAPSELRFGGQPYQAGSPAVAPPFSGQWTFFSWSPDGWVATHDLIWFEPLGLGSQFHRPAS